MKLTDEILNKCIDNELSAAEMRELKDHLAANPSEVEKLKALKLTDNILRELEFDSAPQNFTEKLMSQLNVVYSSKPHKNYFIKIVFALFAIGFIGVSLFGLSQISAGSGDNGENKFEHVFERIGEILPAFSFSISQDTMMLIVSILVLVTLISTYLIVNSHKAFKNNLENLSH